MTTPDITDRTEQAFDTRNTVRDEWVGREPSEEDSLLQMAPADAAKQMLKEWDQSWKAVAPYIEQWKVNRARSQGYTGVQLIKKQDRSQAYIPTGA